MINNNSPQNLIMNKFFGKKENIPYKIHKKIDTDIHFISFSKNNDKNTLSHQGIKIGDRTYKLIFFENSHSNLIYYFEKDIILKFYNRKSQIMIQIIHPKYKRNDIQVWNHDIASTFTSLSWNELTKELDYLNILSYEYANEK